MEKQEYVIEFPSSDTAEATIFAQELREFVLDVQPEVSADTRRADPLSQDFGSTLIIVLAGPAVVAVAKAVGDWLRLRRQAKITIRTAAGEVIAENITSDEALELQRMWLQQG